MSRRLLIAARSVVPHRTAGYHRMTWDLASGLHGRGWDVTVLTTPVPGRGREFGAKGLHVVTVPGTWGERGQRRWDRDVPQVAQRLGLESFDAVLGVGPAGQVLRPRTPRSVFHCRDTVLNGIGESAKARGLPLALPPLRSWTLRRLARELDYLRRADDVVVPGPHARDALWRWPYRAVARSQASVVRSGVPTRRFRPDPAAALEWRDRKGIGDDVPLVLTVCRLEPGKGLLDAVAAFRAFRALHRKARYVLVGTGPGHTEVRRRVLDLNVGAHVDFLGRLPDSHVVRWLQAADLFLFLPPAAEVRPPLNVVEAVACGTPVVATSTALDPATPHPLLHPVAPGDAAAAAFTMSRVWARRGRIPSRALPSSWTMEATAHAYDAVLRGRRA